MLSAEEEKVVAKLKAERTQLRRCFTKAANEFEDVFRSEDKGKDISVNFSKVSEKADRLFKIDEQLTEIVTLTDDEYDVSESYRDKFVEIRVAYGKSRQDDMKLLTSAKALADNLKLPKLNLKEFDLVPRAWVAFWGQFSLIHEDERLREEDKFQYLISSLKPNTRAREIVESYPPSKDNYPKVIEHIKSRFGRDDLLIEVYIRDLLALVTNKSGVKLTVLYDQLGTYLRALATLGVTTEKYAAMLYPVVESCLPMDVLKAWDRHRLNKDSEFSSSYLTKDSLLEELMKFLSNEVEGEEHRSLAESGFSKYKKQSKEMVQNDIPTASSLFSASDNASFISNCVFCDKRHNSQECRRAAQMSLKDKKAAIMKKKCCLTCLKVGHFSRSCRSNVRCLLCNQRHHVIMCSDLDKRSVESLPKGDKGEEDNSAAMFTAQPLQREIYLKTVMLRLRHKGKQICATALLDDGSHRSYIEKSLAAELSLAPIGTEVLSKGLFGGGITPATRHRRYKVTVEGLDGKFATPMYFLDQQKICTTLPRIRDENLLSKLSLRGIALTDVGNDTPPIRVLLGADVLGTILTGRVEVFKSGVSAIETVLGWTVLGLEKKKEVFNMVTFCLQSLEVQKMWDLDTLGITDPMEDKPKKILDEETVVHFQETLRINSEQRYEVALPWLVGHPPLHNNREVAVSRLRAVTKRLAREDILAAYNDVFMQWKSEGIIEEVNSLEDTAPVYYLPHRPVVNLSSTTTKIRPVFDASVKIPGCASLNDCLSTGPSLTEQIPSLLNRFRVNAIGVTADIKQAFLQISVRPEDRNVLRFLWWKDTECSNVVEYRHCRVVFGVTSSPFLLNATISHHLSLEKFQSDSMAFTMEKLKGGFYVDNLVTSVKDEKEFQVLQRQAREIFDVACFDLRCWNSTGNCTILGLNWSTDDELTCAVPKVLMDSDKVATKRSLLAIANSVYDPIGFSCPAMLSPKLILQEAWRKNVGWDDPLPEELQLKFNNWIKHIDMIEKCSIPRRMFRGKIEDATLHIFSDASAVAYACCVFLRCKDQGQVFLQLVSAKARVAPMNRTTIPRMELLGATIAARLYKSTMEALNLPLKACFWTDSMVVLAWVKKKETWNTFVGNRVKEIRELTDADSWRHVPGDLNPADLPSRSCTWLDLSKKRWWEGPSWLQNEESAWPVSTVVCPEEALLERRKVVISASSIQGEMLSHRFLYFSKYSKVIRMVAWILRFVDNAKNKGTRVTSELTSEEIQKAERSVIRLVQRERFPELEGKYSKSIRFSEESGVLKVETKLVLGEDPEDFQRPTVLPDHPIVRLYIEHVHKAMMHSGVQTTLNHIRELYWIPRGRRVVREVISKCVVCKRHSSKPVQPNTAPLPLDRTKRIAAFQVTGVDLAGPLQLRQGIKAWIVLFTCAVYRAVHLELVTSLSSEAFMQAMRRFFARRGRCSVMYSDNGTNFTGTARAFQSLNWEEIQSECALQSIKWRFSPPTAPWYGGWWERMVRSIKEILRKCLGKACVTYEEMLTLLCEAESVINGRPLTYLSDDPKEMTPITPAHFIQDIRGSETHDLDIVDSKHLLRRVRYVQSLRENLRKRFQKEYLAELVRNPQSKSKQKAISVGEIVLVGSESTKRLNWPLGFVEELYPGKDGIQRVAKLRVANGYLVRPLQRLYPLEMSIRELPSDMAGNGRDEHANVDGEHVESSTATVPRARNPKTETLIPTTEVSQPVKRARSGRIIVPPQRLDL